MELPYKTPLPAPHFNVEQNLFRNTSPQTHTPGATLKWGGGVKGKGNLTHGSRTALLGPGDCLSRYFPLAMDSVLSILFRIHRHIPYHSFTYKHLPPPWIPHGVSSRILAISIIGTCSQQLLHHTYIQTHHEPETSCGHTCANPCAQRPLCETSVRQQTVHPTVGVHSEYIRSTFGVQSEYIRSMVKTTIL